MSSSSNTARSWFAFPLLTLGCAGFAALWMLLALATNSQCAWMAVVAALDIALLQKLASWRKGPSRALLALLATASVIMASNVLIAAGHVGQEMGLRPWESALKIGPDYAHLLIRLANTSTDWTLYASSLALALWTGLSGRRPTPSTR